MWDLRLAALAHAEEHVPTPYLEGVPLPMGPVMPPSKQLEASSLSRTRLLGRTLQEDEELTNLNWLHESKNLLDSFGEQVLRSVSPLQEPDDDAPPSPSPPPDLPGDGQHNPNCKPPYSFSCLIFMAIEDAPAKRLPVKDIYNWILEHFPYFASAPTGWKNSVRHNLSLNKCFRKVDKDRSQNIGKGSLWCIDPEYRQNLIQALKKTPFQPYSPLLATPPSCPQTYQSLSSPALWPASPFFRRNGEVLLPVPQGVIQNGARMLSQGLFPALRALPITPLGSRTAAMRSVLAGCRMRSDSEPPCDLPLVSSDPKDDHNYSSAISCGLLGDPLTAGPGEEVPLPGEVEVKKEPRDWPLKRQYWTRVRQRDTLPLKKRRTEKPPESDDEEMKEAAGSLLHLAGVRACLNNITNRAAKAQREQKEAREAVRVCTAAAASL